MAEKMTAEQARADFQKWAVLGLGGLQPSWRESPGGAAMPAYFLRRSDEDFRTYHYDVVETAFLAWTAASATTWQPIETAPRDGTEIVVCWPKVEVDEDCELTNKVVGYVRAVSSYSCGFWVEPEFFEANGPSFEDDWDFAMSPSHWMPLPDVPPNA